MRNRLAQVREERGWKKARLLHELRTAAARRGEHLPKDESLARRIAVWENQGGTVSEFYCELLGEVYGCSTVELGLVEAPSAEPVADEPITEPFDFPEFTRLDPGLVALLRSQTQTLRLLDRRLGGSSVHGLALANVEAVERLVRNALPGTAREQAADELGQAAALAGWQALDMGQLPEAWRLHEIATAAARESGEPSGLGYSRAQQAFILLDAGRAADARELIVAAREHAGGPVPRELLAWLRAAEGGARRPRRAGRRAPRSRLSFGGTPGSTRERVALSDAGPRAPRAVERALPRPARRSIGNRRPRNGGRRHGRRAVRARGSQPACRSGDRPARPWRGGRVAHASTASC